MSDGGAKPFTAPRRNVDAGVKLVVYDRLIEGFTADTFVGDIMGDNVGIGKAMGEYLNEFYADDDDVQYLRFVGDSSTVTKPAQRKAWTACWATTSTRLPRRW